MSEIEKQIKEGLSSIKKEIADMSREVISVMESQATPHEIEAVALKMFKVPTAICGVAIIEKKLACEGPEAFISSYPRMVKYLSNAPVMARFPSRIE